MNIVYGSGYKPEEVGFDNCVSELGGHNIIQVKTNTELFSTIAKKRIGLVVLNSTMPSGVPQAYLAATRWKPANPGRYISDLADEGAGYGQLIPISEQLLEMKSCAMDDLRSVAGKGHLIPTIYVSYGQKDFTLELMLGADYVNSRSDGSTDELTAVMGQYLSRWIQVDEIGTDAGIPHLIVNLKADGNEWTYSVRALQTTNGHGPSYLSTIDHRITAAQLIRGARHIDVIAADTGKQISHTILAPKDKSPKTSNLTNTELAMIAAGYREIESNTKQRVFSRISSPDQKWI